jgi:hypothetical protein
MQNTFWKSSKIEGLTKLPSENHFYILYMSCNKRGTNGDFSQRTRKTNYTRNKSLFVETKIHPTFEV